MTWQLIVQWLALVVTIVCAIVAFVEVRKIKKTSDKINEIYSRATKNWSDK